MTSPPPLLYNTYYHIYNRGVNGENLFFEERNYDLFLRLYEKHLSLVTDLFAYCLLKNHFHLSLRVKAEDEMTKKTLRDSFETHHPINPIKTSIPGSGKPAKPLGSRYVSDQFSNFF